MEYKQQYIEHQVLTLRGANTEWRVRHFSHYTNEYHLESCATGERKLVHADQLEERYSHRIGNLYNLVRTEYVLKEGKKRFWALVKTHYQEYNRKAITLTPYYEPEYIKEWERACEADWRREIELNDWARWNTELPATQAVEVNEAIYMHLLEVLPPRHWHGDYFEVGEAHHMEGDEMIYRACWKRDGRFYTGHPKAYRQLLLTA